VTCESYHVNLFFLKKKKSPIRVLLLLADPVIAHAQVVVICVVAADSRQVGGNAVAVDNIRQQIFSHLRPSQSRNSATQNTVSFETKVRIKLLL